MVVLTLLAVLLLAAWKRVVPRGRDMLKLLRRPRHLGMSVVGFGIVGATLALVLVQGSLLPWIVTFVAALVLAFEARDRRLPIRPVTPPQPVAPDESRHPPSSPAAEHRAHGEPARPRRLAGTEDAHTTLGVDLDACF